MAGIPAPIITWSRIQSGQEVVINQPENKFDIQSEPVTGEFDLVTVTSQLMISDLVVSDQSTYYCRGSNGVENAIEAIDVSSATLTVHSTFICCPFFLIE